MFADIPQRVLDRMRELEQIDASHRSKGTPRLERLRQIPPETGRFVALMAVMAPAGRMIEIGTSGGYSTLWLSLACRHSGRTITTFEILEGKADIARKTLESAAVEEVVDLVIGDALDHLDDCSDVAFCFLDAEKDVYLDCYEKIVPKMVSGGILVADNARSHKVVLEPMLDRALSDARVGAMIVPIGSGELLCRKR
jgi:predicted O-methyltransferase YrrM